MRSVFGRSGISSGFGRKRGGGVAPPFALLDAQWTLVERPEDANRKRPLTTVNALPPATKRFLWSRTANPSGIPTANNFGEMTEIGLGQYQAAGVSQVTSAEEQVVIWLVDESVPPGVPCMVDIDGVMTPNPAVTRASLNKPFQPSGLPYAPTLTPWADGSGTAVELRFDPRSVHEGNGRNGVTPWRAVDQIGNTIDGGSESVVADADTVNLTGLSGEHVLSSRTHNVNGWGATPTVMTIHSDLTALGPSDWSVTDAGDGVHLLVSINAPLINQYGSEAIGFLYELDTGAAEDLEAGGAVPAAVGSHGMVIRGVFPEGIGMPSDEKTASVAGLQAAPARSGAWELFQASSGTTRTPTMPAHAAGMTLIHFATIDGSADPTGVTAGWTMRRINETSHDPGLFMFYKENVPDGAQALTYSVVSGIKVRGYTGAFTDAESIIFGSVADGTTIEQYGASSTSIDLGNLVLDTVATKALAIAVIGRSGTSNAQSTPGITGWDDFVSANSGTSSADVGIAICQKAIEDTAINPPAWGTATRTITSTVIALIGAASGAAVALSGASLSISPESPVETDTTTFAFSFAAGTTPANVSLTINGTTYNSTTGVFALALPAGSYPYTWSSSNAAGAGPSGSGTLVVAAAPTITASVSLSPSSPTAGQIVTATVTVFPTDATPNLSVLNGGSSVSITPGVPGVWTFTAPATGTTTVTPTATLDSTVVSGTPATFSTGAAPVSANAPKLWGVPEVGDLLEFIAGTGVSSPSYLIERTDNGGSTYATEKTAATGEFFVVPNQVGRQYRAVMVAPDTTRTVGAWTEPVAAAGPQIAVASVDGRTLAVQTPAGTGTLRARPYGGGTAITAAVSGATTNITLTGNGCWQIDYAPDGVTYGALAYRWCYTFGLVSFFGRNASTVGVKGGITSVVPISGRQFTCDAPTPVLQVTDEICSHPTTGADLACTFYTNGVMLNHETTLDYQTLGRAAWDNRLFSAKLDPNPLGLADGRKYQHLGAANNQASQRLANFDPAALWTKWPAMMAVGDAISKVASGPDGRFIGRNQGHRLGLIDQHAALSVVSALPTSTQLPAQIIRHPAWVPGNIDAPNLASVIATYQGMSLSTAGMSVPNTANVLALLEKFNPALACYRGGDNDSDSKDRVTTFRNSLTAANGQTDDEGNGAYYQNDLVDAALFLLFSDAVDATWKERCVIALAVFGSQIDVPYKQAQSQAGISVHHETLIMFSRIVCGLPFEDLYDTQPGNYLTVYSTFEAGDLPRLRPHTNPAYPAFSRICPIVNVTTHSSGDYLVHVQHPKTDGSKHRFTNMELVRQSVPGDTITVIANGDGTVSGNYTTYALRVSPAQFSTPPVIGESVYCRPPLAARTVIEAPGFGDWDNSRGQKGPGYNPNPLTSYRNIGNKPHAMVATGHVLGVFPSTPKWQGMNNYIVNSLLPSYPAAAPWDYSFTAEKFVREMWIAHHATLGL